MEKDRTLLIVDDVPVNRAILSAIFGEEYNIIEAGDGLEAVEIISREYERISIIILDLTMPRMDGFEVLGIIKKEPHLAEIPVVIVSSAEIDAEIKALEIGASDFISKPFDSRVVTPRINNLVAKREYESVRLENIKLQEEAKLQKKIQVMFDTVPGGIAIFEGYGHSIRMVMGNDGLFGMFGYSSGEHRDIFFNNFASIVHPDDRANLSNFGGDMHPFAINVRILKIDGTWLWTMITAKPILSGQATIQFYAVLVDISTEQKIKAELQYRAEYDQLTGIYNKDTFYMQTSEMFKAHPGTKYVLMRSNIERFKLINDLFGKAAGDTILKIIADLFQHAMAPLGTYGRLEGDHFAACIPQEELLINKLQKKIAERFSTSDVKYPISVGLGLYIVDDTSIPVELMCDRANLALQTIKGKYLIRYAYYDNKLRDVMVAEQEIQSEMKNALSTRQFQIYLQPIYSVSTGKPASAEVLIRWIHPVKGLIPPNKFIPIFEQSGFIAELDYYVWEEACSYLKRRKDAGHPDFPVSVNVSRMSLYNSNLFDEIVKLTRKYGVHPTLFRIEITETAYSDNPNQLLATINALQGAGFPILMDDFGSGYSSLNTLKDIPVDILKIDMKFLESFETSNKAGNILTSIVRMAKWLELAVIAEGVETKNQVDFLSSIGCDKIQGYYFARPMPVQDFETHIASAGSAKQDDKVDMPDEEDKVDIDMLLGNQFVDKLLGGISGGIGFYEISNSGMEIVRVNKTYYDIMGLDPSSFMKTSRNVYDSIYADDRGMFEESCLKAAEEKTPRKIPLRIQRDDGQIAALEASISYFGRLMERSVLCITFIETKV
ncbi:MAG: EAL domain-containing protein [Spirochaetia bacterium]|jgi:diguanylate cyclase (GGDEF)-like protein|nr:EAL domain-containing protein [Spirochaetia bacterium]